MNKKEYYFVHLKYIFGTCLCFLLCLLPICVAIWLCFESLLIEKWLFCFLSSFYFFIAAFYFKIIFYYKFKDKIPENDIVAETIYQNTNELSCKNIKEICISDKQKLIVFIKLIRPKKYIISFSKEILKFSSIDTYLMTLHEIAHAKTYALESANLLRILKTSFAFLGSILCCLYLQKYDYSLEFFVYTICSIGYLLAYCYVFKALSCWTCRQSEYLADVIAVKISNIRYEVYIKMLKKVCFKHSKNNCIPLNHDLFDSHPAMAKRFQTIENIFQ